jgi:hypothetical protein
VFDAKHRGHHHNTAPSVDAGKADFDRNFTTTQGLVAKMESLLFTPQSILTVNILLNLDGFAAASLNAKHQVHRSCQHVDAPITLR